MKHLKKAMVWLALAVFLLSALPLAAGAEGTGTVEDSVSFPNLAYDYVTSNDEAYETGGSYVAYPLFYAIDPETMESYASTIVDRINHTILETCHIGEYEELLSTFQPYETGLQMDCSIGMNWDWYEGVGKVSTGRYISLLFSVHGKMLSGRPSQIYYPLTFDLATGDLVSFDQLFSDPEGAKAFIEKTIEDEIEPDLSTYLENNQLFPVPYDRFFLDGQDNISFVYENSQLSFLSGYSGAVSFNYGELADWLDLSPDGVAAQISEWRMVRAELPTVSDSEFFWGMLRENYNGHAWFPGKLPRGMDFILHVLFRSTVDPYYYPGGEAYEVEDAQLRGTLFLTDGGDTVYGLLTSRAYLMEIQTGKTALSDAERFLGREPAARITLDEAAAEMYLVCTGTASVYRFEDGSIAFTFTLYADQDGIVQYIKYAQDIS